MTELRANDKDNGKAYREFPQWVAISYQGIPRSFLNKSLSASSTWHF